MLCLEYALRIQLESYATTSPEVEDFMEKHMPDDGVLPMSQVLETANQKSTIKVLSSQCLE